MQRVRSGPVHEHEQHRGDVDVWAVDGVDEDAFLENPDGVGFFYVPFAIPADRLTLMATDIPAAEL